MKKVLFFMLIFMCSAIFINAQSNYQFHVGASLPSGKFADDDYENAISGGSGYASTGINLGIERFIPLSTKGLSLTIGVDFFLHGLSSDFKDELEDKAENADITYPKYINIPAIIGLNYQLPIADNMSFFGEAGLGFNYFKMTNWKEEWKDDAGESAESTMKFDPSFKLCYKIGGGISFNKKYSIGLSYFGLGSHKLKYETKTEGQDKTNDKFRRALDISALNLTFGISF